MIKITNAFGKPDQWQVFCIKKIQSLWTHVFFKKATFVSKKKQHCSHLWKMQLKSKAQISQLFCCWRTQKETCNPMFYSIVLLYITCTVVVLCWTSSSPVQMRRIQALYIESANLSYMSVRINRQNTHFFSIMFLLNSVHYKEVFFQIMWLCCKVRMGRRLWPRPTS